MNPYLTLMQLKKRGIRMDVKQKHEKAEEKTDSALRMIGYKLQRLANKKYSLLIVVLIAGLILFALFGIF